MSTFYGKNLGFLLRRIGVLLIISSWASSCKAPSRSQVQQSLELNEKFVKYKYQGRYRYDSLFNQELKNHVAKLSIGTSKDQFLEIAAEWNLLAGDYIFADLALDSLSHKSKSNGNYDWLLSFHEATQGNHRQAISLLEKIASDATSDSTVVLKSHWLLGSIYEEDGLDSLAISHYQKAKDKGPLRGHVDYYLESVFHSGNILFSRGEVEKAQVEYKKALAESIEHEVDRLTPFGYYHLGKIAEHLNEHEKALEFYDKSKRVILKKLAQTDHFMLGILESKIENLK
ncbi:MAG: tetratricopeptide repeat protein [Cyclobacteriaceae bacterium]